MKFIRDFFSSILGFLLVLTLSTYVVILSFTNVFLKPAVFLKILDSHQTYEKITTEILPQTILSNFLKTQDNGQINQETIDKVASLVDKEKLKPLSVQFKKVVEDGYYYAIGQNANFEEKIDLTNNLTQLKESFSSGLKTAEAQGLITAPQSNEILQNLPTNKNLTLIVTPDKIALVSGAGKLEEPTPTPNQKFSLKTLRASVANTKQAENLTLISTIILALLLFASRIPDWAASFKWLGGSLFAAGIFPLVLSFVLLWLHPLKILEQFILNQKLSVSPVMLSLATANLGDLLNKFLENLRLYSLVLVIAAVVCYLATWGLHKLNKPKTTTVDTGPLKT
ncbi:MAG TPA: hypothetical protein VLE47_01240 [Candidatus Saccharimonadales bacterium]|nr:hypothetical protein [Candidatus Saccharimonadales bacterium]